MRKTQECLAVIAEENQEEEVKKQKIKEKRKVQRRILNDQMKQRKTITCFGIESKHRDRLIDKWCGAKEYEDEIWRKEKSNEDADKNNFKFKQIVCERNELDYQISYQNDLRKLNQKDFKQFYQKKFEEDDKMEEAKVISKKQQQRSAEKDMVKAWDREVEIKDLQKEMEKKKKLLALQLSNQFQKS